MSPACLGRGFQVGNPGRADPSAEKPAWLEFLSPVLPIAESFNSLKALFVLGWSFFSHSVFPDMEAQKTGVILKSGERPFPVNLSSTANETSQKWPKTTQITFRGGKLRMTGWFRG
jgi:hypothetical protein